MGEKLQNIYKQQKKMTEKLYETDMKNKIQIPVYEMYLIIIQCVIQAFKIHHHYMYNGIIKLAQLSRKQS